MAAALSEVGVVVVWGTPVGVLFRRPRHSEEATFALRVTLGERRGGRPRSRVGPGLPPRVAVFRESVAGVAAVGTHLPGSEDAASNLHISP